MKQYKATPDQWEMLEELCAPEYDTTILELRSRIEALETELHNLITRLKNGSN